MDRYDPNGKGALWTKTAKSGKKFLSGEITIDSKKHYISVFKNEKKTSEKQPDYNMVVNKPDWKEVKGSVEPEFADDMPF